jgi:replicative DNA helicase
LRSKKNLNPYIEIPTDPRRARDFLGVQNSAEIFLRNPAIIKEAQDKLTSFGNPFLDRALLGMLPSELVCVMAKSNVGKTQMILEMAKNLSMTKKRVLFIALESEQNEIEFRLEFQLFAQSFYYDKDKPHGVIFNYRNYRFGKLNSLLKKYSDKVREIYHQRYEHLEVFYRKKEFTIENLKELMRYASQSGISCVVIDHLMVFDLFGQDPENQEMSRLIKDIRDLNLHHSIPVIVAAHTRKMNTNLLGLDDIRGTSDIAKIATTVIGIASRPDSYDPVSSQIDTIIQVLKSRAGGKISEAGLMKFNLQMQCYLPEYRLAKTIGDNVEEMRSDELPYWVKGDSFCLNYEMPPQEEHY